MALLKNNKRYWTSNKFYQNKTLDMILDGITTDINGVSKFKFVNTFADEIHNSIPKKVDIQFPVVEVPSPSVHYLWKQHEVGDVVTSSKTTREVTGRKKRRFRDDIYYGIDTTTTTKSQTETTTDVTANTVSSLIPFMRAKRIYFRASSMKPNSKLYAFFDGFDVTNLCTLTSGETGKVLKVGENGRISGFFDLPADRFKSGVRDFVLRDVIDPSKDVATTTASAKYRSQGVRNDTTITYNITNVTSVQTSVNRQAVSWKDPVAQSFSVDTAGTPNGFFLSSIDLFFSSVESGDIVTVEVRKVTNGYPNSNKFNEYSSVELGSDDVKVSADGSVATNFKFGTPIYLPNDSEYCFVIYSNSEKTEIFVSELGKRNFLKGDTLNATGEIIAKQPYLGSLFISQNRTTWNAEQTKDVKFKIYRCEFDDVGIVRFANKTFLNDGTSNHVKLLNSNPLRFKNNSAEVYIECLGHGMKEGDKFLLSFGNDVPETLFGVPKSLLQGVVLTVNKSDFVGFSVLLGVNAEGEGNAGGEYCSLVGYNIAYSAFDLRMKYSAVDGTNVINKFGGRRIDRYSNNNTVTDIDVLNDKTNVLDKTYIVKNNADGGFQLISTLSTDDKCLSPIIESNTASVKLHRNLIDGAENNTPAMYIQKNVELSKPSNQLKIFFDYNLRAGCGIIVEVLFNKNKDDYYNAKDSEWQVINPLSPLVVNLNANDYQLASYQVSNAGFNSFAVRIRFTTLNNAIVPSIANYRAIALLTTD